MFHLPYLAAALDEQLFDYRLLIGLYPLPLFKLLLNVLPIRSKTKAKILERRQNIPSSRVCTSVVSEILAHTQSLSHKFKLERGIRNKITEAVHNYFSRQAGRHLQRFRPHIYHYRSSFGLKSLEVAHKTKAIKLCDHSIAHPYHIQYLIDNAGKLPNSAFSSNLQLNESALIFMERDLDDADHIVVNSSFVRKSLEVSGIPASKISVIELSVDQKIIQYSTSSFASISKLSPSNLIYAGGWIKRKGVIPLAQAVELLQGDVQLRIAGASEGSVKALCAEYKVSTSHLKPLGYLSRMDIAKELLESQIFVFPSFCEGYAKTIQEAMVCGCYIIATENSGFTLFPGAHGAFVRPGDPEHLAQVILEAIADPRLNEYCMHNRAAAIQRFSAEMYGEKMQSLYHELLKKY